MSKIKCIVIEDEPLATEILVEYIEQIPFLELQGTFKDAVEATEFLRNNPTDLMFLDIHLPKIKGMAFLKTLTNPPAVIITTAYHQYALEGFELNVTDYLLKPIEFERFFNAVNKVNKLHKPLTTAGDVKSEKDHLYITADQKKVRILFSELLYIESQKEYIKIVTTSKTYLSRMGTSEIEELLPPHRFKRVHRSYIIALDKIVSYSSDEVQLKNATIPIGRAYRGILDES